MPARSQQDKTILITIYLIYIFKYPVRIVALAAFCALWLGHRMTVISGFSSYRFDFANGKKDV